jgi:hypothetical protein
MAIRAGIDALFVPSGQNAKFALKEDFLVSQTCPLILALFSASRESPA